MKRPYNLLAALYRECAAFVLESIKDTASMRVTEKWVEVYLDLCHIAGDLDAAFRDGIADERALEARAWATVVEETHASPAILAKKLMGPVQ